MKTTLRWMASNSPLMVLALILAALAWMVALEESDPALEGRYSQAIPVILSEPPEGMVLVGEFEENAQFTVYAPQSVWNVLKDEDFSAVVDLTDLNAGIHQAPIEWALNKQPARVVQVEPEYVSVELEPEAERTVPVHVQIMGEATLGYLTHTLTMTPNSVTVRGPSTYVAQVVKVVAQVSIQDATTNVEGEFRLQVQDSDGRSVPHVAWTHETVHVHIPIELSVRYRPLVVKVVLAGEQAAGYRITEIAVEPPDITVVGTPGSVAALPGFIETEPINLEGAQSDIVAQPVLDVPPYVSMATDEQPVVTVSIEPIQTSLTMVITPEIQGLGPGFTFTVSPESVEVILSGPLPLLETLEDDDARVVLDLFELLTGTHQIEPQIIVPEGVSAQSFINPATVQVEIFVAADVEPSEN